MSAVSERPAARRLIADEATPRAAFEVALSEHSEGLGDVSPAKPLGSDASDTDGSCVWDFTALQNQRGVLHGGVLATAMDIWMGRLVQPIGGPGATVTLEGHYHRAVSSGRVRCKGKTVHRVGSLWFLNTRVTAENGDLVALGTCTIAMARKAGA